MDAYLSFHADRIGHRGTGWQSDQDFDRTSTTIGEIRGSLEWTTFPFKISCFSIWPHRFLDRILRGLVFRKLEVWPCLFSDSHLDRFFPNVYRGASFI